MRSSPKKKGRIDDPIVPYPGFYTSRHAWVVDLEPKRIMEAEVSGGAEESGKR
jgi:hypothetical protein